MRFSQWAKDPRHTSRWKKVRRQMLISYPRCERCGSRISTEVHHIKSAILYRDYAFDMEWLRSVCHWCHVDADKKAVAWRPRNPPPGGGPDA